MAKQVQPIPQFAFGGVVTAGHPLLRPSASCSKCENFRIMPGNWLRLRSGRLTRMHQAAGKFIQFGQFRASGQGFTQHPVQHYDGTDTKWKWLSVFTWVFDPFFTETISGVYDGNWSQNNLAAMTNLRNRMVLYNGLGVRDATNSRPPFSSGDSNSALRYFGLDAYTQAGNPTVAFAAGAGNNTVAASVRIFVGLHNTATQHYSNGVYAGEITATGGLGTITVSNLNRLKTAFHNTAEQNELKYVFYATVDGYRIPYLILDAAGTSPFTVASTATSASLSISSGTTNGWYLDLTAEMPTTNHPPRPMRTAAYVNGRIYGVLMSGGSGSAVLQQGVDGETRADFTYVPDARQFAGIVYSAAAGESLQNDRLGVPEESWPLHHFSPTPNSEIPVRIDSAPAPQAANRLLVVTPSGTFLVEEAPDGIHEWIDVSRIHGIIKAETYARTPYGAMWVTQRNQIALLQPNSRFLEIVSTPYQSLLAGKVTQAAAYILDPVNEVDRYEVFFTDGTSLIHDFAVGSAYTATNRDYTAAATLTDADAKQYHVAAKQHLYTHEGQPEDGKAVTFDRNYTSPTTTADSEFTGTYEAHYENMGDDSLTKALPHVDVIGDENTKLDWWADLETVNDANKKQADRIKTPQSDTDQKYRHRLSEAERFWYKLRFTLASHSVDQSKYERAGDQADLDAALYGSIAVVARTASIIGENRP